MSDSQTTDATSELAAANPRWWALAIILAAGAILIGCFQGLPGLYPGLRSVGIMATAGGVLILYFVWLLQYSRLTGKFKIVGIAIVLLPIAAFFTKYGIDDWDGDMWPIFVDRWAAGPQEQLAEFLEDSLPVDVSKLRKSSDADYPGFMGHDRRGVIENLQLETDWEKHPPKELWRHPVGIGWSAFAVAGDFAITQEQREAEECVVAYELKTGKQIWAHADAELFSKAKALGGDGPRATPTIDGERVYALGAKGILNCLELTTGKRLWSTNILEDASAENVTWGMAGSPLIVDDLVVVCPGGEKGYCVVAYDKTSGKLVWHGGSEKETAGYTSPILTTLGGQLQIVMHTGIGLSGYHPNTGEMLWHYPWAFAEGQVIICSQPLIPGEFGDTVKNQVMMSCGYGIGSEMLELVEEDGKMSPRRAWTTSDMKSKFANMVVHGDDIYGLSEGILDCVDLKTGKKKVGWKNSKGRFGHGQMILIGDVILIQSEKVHKGAVDVVLIEANGSEFKLLARLPALSSKTWNAPAIAGNLLLVRNDREAACYELPIKGAE